MWKQGGLDVTGPQLGQHGAHRAAEVALPFWPRVPYNGAMARTVTTLMPLVLLLLLLSQCASMPRTYPPPPYTVETLTAACQSRPVLPEIRVAGNSVILTEAIQTPNPCYTIRGHVEMTDHHLDVELYPVRREEVCVQCIGELVGRITITDLPAGDYSVTLRTRQRETNTTITIKD